MNFINFKDITGLSQLLDRLGPNQQPAFGMMTPQHMVEHLALVMTISNGKIKVAQASPDEKIPALVQFLLSPHPLPEGFKAPFISRTELTPLKFKDLDEARINLIEEITNFNNYYHTNPEKKELHPVFGFLDKQQWEIFHRKHFTHHFRQFDLVGDII